MHAYASMLVSVDTLYHYTLTAKVETQDFASHEEVVLHGMKIWRVITRNIN